MNHQVSTGLAFIWGYTNHELENLVGKLNQTLIHSVFEVDDSEVEQF